MATLDIILLCCFIPGIIRGLSKGFLEQALALAGVVLSVWAAFHFSNLVCSWLKPYLDVSETTLNVISFAVILVGISIGVILLAKLLTKVVELAMLGWLNKMLWGGSALLAFEHVWHGEVVPFFPFLTAVKDGEASEMLHEMATAGVCMALLVTAAWGIMVGVVSMFEKKSKNTDKSAVVAGGLA